MEYYIYTLRRKDSHNIFYVGSTNNMSKRVKWHNSWFKCNLVIEELEVCSENDRYKSEGYWINQMIAWGYPLVNIVIPGVRNKIRKPLHRIGRPI